MTPLWPENLSSETSMDAKNRVWGNSANLEPLDGVRGGLRLKKTGEKRVVVKKTPRDATFQGAGGIGGILATTDNASNTAYFCYDGNGNVVNLIDGADQIVADYRYDPFGNRLDDPTDDIDNPYQWSTKETHTTTGLVYYLYRYYSPELGRWINRDPIEEDGGVNLYEFSRNNAINYFDVDGRYVDGAKIAREVAKLTPALEKVGMARYAPLITRVAVLAGSAILGYEAISDLVAYLEGEEIPYQYPKPLTNLLHSDYRAIDEKRKAWTDSQLKCNCPKLADGMGEVFYGSIIGGGQRTGVAGIITKGYADAHGGRVAASINPPGYRTFALLNKLLPRVFPQVHKGHILARSLGGAGNKPENFVTLEKHANTPLMRDAEREIKSHLVRGETVCITAQPQYLFGKNIPVLIKISGRTSDDKIFNYTVANHPFLPQWGPFYDGY